MKHYYYIIIYIFFVSCSDNTQKSPPVSTAKKIEPIRLDKAGATNLIELPLSCILQEYPNKLNQVIGGNEDLQSPQALHPSFYGCFDWHSAVHGHWSLVKLCKQFPNLAKSKSGLEMLEKTITVENISKELLYFEGKHNTSYERTYGWAWLLKLAEELHTWENPRGQKLASTLQPLTDLIVDRYLEFLPKLVYPIRVGEHTNTAFGLGYAHDYAVATNSIELKNLIEKRSLEYYNSDTTCPLSWEPSGYDFISPCLEEANLMARVLPKEEYVQWLDLFLPQLANKDFTLEVGKVSDRTDGKLVHLDGLNFSRAWSLYRIAKVDQKYDHLISIANNHVNHSLPGLVGDTYEGGHWLGSFAIYALMQ